MDLNNKEWSNLYQKVHSGNIVKKHDERRFKQLDFFNLIPNKSAKILDIGCGNGNTIKVLHKRKYENVMGLDVKNILQGKLRPLFIKGNLTKKNKNIKNGTFDAVTTIETLHHLKSPTEIILALNEIRRITKKKGYTFYLEPENNALAKVQKFLFSIKPLHFSKNIKNIHKLIKNEEDVVKNFYRNIDLISNYNKKNNMKLIYEKKYLQRRLWCFQKC